ncbi:MAG: lytic transglycosylase domain-containing protein, partial [Acidobacteria bacterium]|nr:lytic transglycosylase domain-containing protein [Acidobacteriota bacterium]
AAREPAALARLAVARGAGTARGALAVALALDPQWVAVATGGELATPVLDPAVSELIAVGFERDAALLLAPSFPHGSPAELAWTAGFLATWGNGPAALTAGETLRARLDGIPAALLPAALHARIVPAGLTSEVALAAAETGAPAPWLFGVIRQESRFDPGARSPAGALGLAQFVPAALERAGASAADAFDPARALRLAGGEMMRLQTVFAGRMTAVAAAYNAGETVTAAWLAELGPNGDDVLLALAIPYSETAGYVLAVGEGARLADHLE